MPQDEAAGERTEEPTQHKLRKAREKGQVAKSRDLNAAVVLLVGMVMLKYGGEAMAERLVVGTKKIIVDEMPALSIPSDTEFVPLVYNWLQYGLLAVLPFMLGLFVVALLINFAQVGFNLSAQPLMPNLGKMNPINNIKRIFGLQGLMTLVMNLLKLTIVVVMAYLVMSAEIERVHRLADMAPVMILRLGSISVIDFGLKLAILFFILGVLDMAYQFYKHNNDLKMTKQEIKEEFKEMEGDPHIKAKRRQIQRQMAMQRMMQEVPEAEVVVRNPTHYAVAIKYKPEMAAPEVVAKGTDKMALRIIDVAIKNSVPVWQAPPLARKLYKIEIGDTIPPELFPALAEILGLVLDKEKKAEFMRQMAA